MCARTFKRDMEDFSSYDKKKDTYDKREPLVTQPLKLAADPTFTKEKRIEAANAIKVMLERFALPRSRTGAFPRNSRKPPGRSGPTGTANASRRLPPRPSTRLSMTRSARKDTGTRPRNVA